MTPSEERVRRVVMRTLNDTIDIPHERKVEAWMKVIDEEVRTAILTTAKVYGRDPSLPDEFNPIISVK